MTRGKPAPDGYLLAAKRLAVTPEQAVVFEDAPAGVVSGRAAGCAVIGVAAASAESALWALCSWSLT